MNGKLPEGFTCPNCGRDHPFGVWVYAHWDETLVKDCLCGMKCWIEQGQIVRSEPRQGSKP